MVSAAPGALRHSLGSHSAQSLHSFGVRNPKPENPPPVSDETSPLPVLADGRLVLRLYDPADVEPLFAAVMASSAELRRWMPWCSADYAIDDTRTFVDFARGAAERGDEYNFGAFRSDEGSIVGSAGLNRRDRVNRSANLGYWVRSDRTGQGIATSAARLVARFGFQTLQLERITIQAALGNRASQRVAQKLGAQYEGVARRAVRVGDEQQDAACFSLIPADWTERP